MTIDPSHDASVTYCRLADFRLVHHASYIPRHAASDDHRNAPTDGRTNGRSPAAYRTVARQQFPSHRFFYRPATNVSSRGASKLDDQRRVACRCPAALRPSTAAPRRQSRQWKNGSGRPISHTGRPAGLRATLPAAAAAAAAAVLLLVNSQGTNLHAFQLSA